MIEPLTDGEIERIRESLRVDVNDPAAARAWAAQAKQDLDRLLEFLTAERRGHGSAFAETLREALQVRIFRQLNGRAELTTDTQVLSLSVAVMPQAVIVDARLELGRWKQ
jgi:hypothetical protein